MTSTNPAQAQPPTRPASRIIERLQKVLALTQSPVEAEAQLAAAKLQELLTAHNLSIADLEKKGAAVRPEVRKDSHDLGKAAFTWKLDLAEAIAEFYYCHPMVDRNTKTVSFVGRPDNVEALQMLYGWLIEQIRRIATEERRRHFDTTGEHIDPLRWQVNFGVGAVPRIEERLREMRARQEEDQREGEITALVLSHNSEISDWLESQGLRRIDGRKTRKEQESDERWEKWFAEREAAAEARAKRKVEMGAEAERTGDWTAYYLEFPEDHPDEIKRREKAQREYEARERRNQRKRDNYIPRGRPEARVDYRKEDQAWTARRTGRKAADKVNLQPFVTGGTSGDKKAIK